MIITVNNRAKGLDSLSKRNINGKLMIKAKKKFKTYPDPGV